MTTNLQQTLSDFIISPERRPILQLKLFSAFLGAPNVLQRLSFLSMCEFFSMCQHERRGEECVCASPWGGAAAALAEAAAACWMAVSWFSLFFASRTGFSNWVFWLMWLQCTVLHLSDTHVRTHYHESPAYAFAGQEVGISTIIWVTIQYIGILKLAAISVTCNSSLFFFLAMCRNVSKLLISNVFVV